MTMPANLKGSLKEIFSARKAQRTFRSVVALALAAVGLPILPFVAGVAKAATSTICGSSGTPTVLSLGDPNFYIDDSNTPMLDANFQGYTIKAGATARARYAITLSNFTGGIVDLAPGVSPTVLLPNLNAGESSTQYFLMKATGPTTSPQTHTVTLSQDGVDICYRTYTYLTVANTIRASANKVISNTPSIPNTPSIIGDLAVFTVVGDTGTLGQGPRNDPGVLSYAPTAFSSFPATGWRLEKTELTISPDGRAAPVTLTDRLVLNLATGPDRRYTAKYYFRTVGYSPADATIYPVQYIASGTQVKHTDIPGPAGGVTLPATSPSSNLVLTLTANPSSFSPTGSPLVTTGGTTTYTAKITNSGSSTGYVDSYKITIPAGTTYVNNSATAGGRNASATLSGRVVTITGPFSIPAGGSYSVTINVTIPNTAATYTATAVAPYGTVQVDSTSTLTDNLPATVDVIVYPVQTLTAVDDSAYTASDTAVVIPVLTNDTPNTGVTITITRNPGGGTATVTGGGTNVTYTPNAGVTGTDTFQYTISNGFTTSTATVTVRIPSARNDNYAAQTSAAGTITGTSGLAGTGALGNDFCPTSACQVVATGTALTGMTLNANGSFTYSYAKNAAGTFTQTYRLDMYASVAGSGSVIATSTATITITLANFAPDFAATPYNTAIGVNVGTNDGACSGSCNLSFQTSAGQPINTPTHGTATFTSGSQVINYAPNNGFWGNDTFVYVRGGNNANSALVNLLTGPPTANITTTFGTPVSANPTNTSYITNYGSPGANTAVVSCSGCSFSISTQPTKGTVSMNASTGEFTYTPFAESSGTDTFVFTVLNSVGLTVTGTVNITIGPLAVDDSITVLATNTKLFNVLDNDKCPGTCTVTRLTSPSSGTLTQTGSTGAFSYENLTRIGTYTFTYRITSSLSGALTSTATVTIRVEGAIDDSATTTVNQAISVNVRSNDPCTDCTLLAVDAPQTGTGTTSISGANTILYTPSTNFVGTVTFKYYVIKNGDTTFATVTIDVGPAAIDDTYVTQYSSTTELDTVLNDKCAVCLITDVGTPSAGSASVINNGGGIQFNTPSSGGPFTFTYTITEPTGLTSTATVTLTTATPPSASDDTFTTSANTPISMLVSGNDTCPEGKTCTFEAASDPSNGTVSPSANSNFNFVYIPNSGFTGADTFTYSIITPEGLSATATVTVYVTPTAVDDRTSAGKNATISINVLTNDTCGTNCSIDSLTQPEAGGGSSSISGSSISYTAPGTPGTYTFTYTIKETTTVPESTSTATVTVFVGDASPDQIATDYQTPVTLNVTDNDACKTASCIVTSTDLTGTPSGDSASIVNSGNSITYTPPSGFKGLVTFYYTATYGPSTATTTVTILVGPAPLTRTLGANETIGGNVLTGVVCSGCTISLVSAPITGDFNIEEDGSYTYVPATDWTGTEPAITYTITDPISGLTRNGTLTITVDPFAPELTVEKSGVINGEVTATNGSVKAGSTITYSYLVTNTGNVSVTNVTVVDDKISDDATNIVCPGAAVETKNVIPRMALAGDPVTCTATYTITQDDIDNGSVTNIATVTGTPTSGTLSPATSELTKDFTQSAELSVTKAAGTITDTDSPSNGAGDRGDTVDYTYVVTNTGNVTLTDVTLTDNKIANSAIECPTGGTSNVIDTLLPGDSVTCGATYTLTKNDVNTGEVKNIATVSGNAPTGATDPSDADSSEVTVTITRTATMTVVKSGSLDQTVVVIDSTDRVDAGDEIAYEYVVSNTGNVTLTDVTVTDDKIPTAASIKCPKVGGSDNVITTLEPGESVTCGVTYTIKQTDVNNGSVTNTATVTATTPTGMSSLLETDDLTIDLARTASQTLDKTSSINTNIVSPNDRVDTDDTITYSFTVKNTGNVTLTDLTVTDPNISSNATNIVCPGKSSASPKNVIDTLQPNTSATCEATYVITLTDMNAGKIDNTATVASSGPDAESNPSNATDSLTTDLTQIASMDVAKSSTIDKTVVVVDSTDRVDAGDTIDYSFEVTNTGNVTLYDLTVVDDKIDNDATSISCPGATTPSNVITSLDPDDSVTCTATYTITLLNMDDGKVANTVTVSGSAPEGATDPTDAEDTLETTLTAAPSVAVVKTGILHDDTVGSVSGQVDAGDTIDYSFEVTNTGNVTLSDLTVVDDKIDDDAADISCPGATTPSNAIATLEPGDSLTCTATYTMSQSDVDEGSVTNTVTVSGTASQGTLNDATDSINKAFTRTSTMTVDKSGTVNMDDVAPDTRVDVGDTISYSYLVTNTGNVTLSNLDVTDDKITSDSTNIVCRATSPKNRIATLAPGDTATCDATYTVTQADLDAGDVQNTVTVSGNGPDVDTKPTDAQDTLDKSLAPVPELTVEKTGTIDESIVVVDGVARVDIGDTISYSYKVTNTGNVTVTDIAVTDDKIASDETNIVCPGKSSSTPKNVIDSLAPGATAVTCTATYDITRTDLDGGDVENTVTVDGTPAQGTLTPATDVLNKTLTRSASLTVKKTSAVDPEVTGELLTADPGDTITYSYEIENTGNVTLTNLTVLDDKIDNDDTNISCPGATEPTNVVASLNAGDIITCTAVYTIIAADKIDDEVTNTVTVSATAPEGTTDPTPAEDTLTTDIDLVPRLSIEKSGVLYTNVVDPHDQVDVGDTIVYTYDVKNIGVVRIDDVTVTDDKIADDTDIVCGLGVDNTVATMAPNATVKCVVTYFITQADIDNGSVTNVATANGTPAFGELTPPEATVTKNLARESSMTVTKTSSIDETVVLPTDRVDAGDEITYSYDVENTGNVTLTNLTVVDDKIADDTDIVCGEGTDNTIAELLPGDVVTCSVVYTITQSNVDDGAVTNTVTVSGSGPDAETKPTDATDELTTDLTRESSMTVTKTSTVDETVVLPTDRVDAGDEITYSYDVENTGNVTLTGITVVDDKIADDTDIVCGEGTDNTIAELLPGDVVTCSVVYTITQSNVNDGAVTNTVTVSGSGPDANSDPSDATDELTTDLTRESSMTVDKSGTVDETVVLPTDRVDTGDKISYSYLVTNTGNVDLTNLTVTDDKISSDATNIVCPGKSLASTKNVIDSLAPGGTATCTASYTIVQGDVDSAGVTNTVTVSGSGPDANSNPSNATDELTKDLTRESSMTVDKSGTVDKTVVSPTDRVDTGDKISYSYLVTNTGNVTLTGLAVTDDKISSDATNIVCPGKSLTSTKNVIDSLAPGGTATCTASYTIVQGDVDSAGVTNTVTVSGSGPDANSNPSNATDELTKDLARESSMTVTKTSSVDETVVSPTDRVDVGDEITYSYDVENTGNVTLTNLTVVDDKIADDTDIVCGTGTDNTISELLPGDVVTCSVVYTITQSNVDDGAVTNTVTVSGSGPDAETKPTDATDELTTDLTRESSMTVTKTSSIDETVVSPADRSDEGDEITYSYDVENTGNVTLTNLTVVDDKIADDTDIVCGEGTDNTIAELLPGDVVTCSVVYTITQSNVDDGGVTNTVTVSGSGPDANSDPSDATDELTTDLTREASMTVDKTSSLDMTVVSPTDRSDEGDEITYSYDVENTGNVTLTNLTVVDDKIADDIDIVCGEGTDNTIAELLPGDVVTCSVVYTITQSNVDDGGVKNTVTVSGSGPDANSDPSDATDELTTDLTREASMTVDKTSSLDMTVVSPTDRSDEGDEITYSFEVENTGNVTLTSLTVSDPLISSNEKNIVCPSASGSDRNVIPELAPGATETCEAIYTLTQADIDAGKVDNEVTVDGSAPTGATDPTDATDTETVDLTREASMTVSKSGTVDKTVVSPTDRVDEGDEITYSYDVENTGNVTLTNLTVVDDKIADDTDIVCGEGTDNTIAELLPGDTVTCSVVYTITQSNVDDGTITNEVTVSGSGPDAETNPTDATDDVTKDFTRIASMTVTKTGTLNNAVVGEDFLSDAGDKVNYSYVVTNTGNVTLTNLTVVDDKIADDTDIVCGTGSDNTIAELLPGASVTCLITVTITSSDIDEASITNVATVSGSGPSGTTLPNATDTEIVVLDIRAIEAIDDSGSAPMGAIITIDVLRNDVGQQLTLLSNTQPSNGTAAIVNGKIVYTPELMFVGVDRFTYTIKQGRLTDVANVTITITENDVVPEPSLFIDSDGDGTRDPLEPGISGVTMDMSLTSRLAVSIPATGGSSVRSFSFAPSGGRSGSGTSASALPIAKFTCKTLGTGACVRPRVPAGKIVVKPVFNPATYSLYVTADSDGGKDLTANLDLTEDGDNVAYFGVRGTGAITGTSYVDSNNDKSFNAATDIPKPNTIVSVVWAGLDGIFGTDDDTLIQTQTDWRGNYVVEGLPVGSYRAAASGATPLNPGGDGSTSAPIQVRRGLMAIADFRVTTKGIAEILPATGAEHRRVVEFALWGIGFGALLLLGSRRRRRISGV